MAAKSKGPALAIFGGEPEFSEPLHVGRPNLPDKGAILERIAAVLDRSWLTNGGPLVTEFEKRIAAQLGVRHCVAMTNGTLALESAIRALDLHGEVIVPAFTFIATAHAVAWQGCTPIFCDVDRATHTIDPHKIEMLIGPRTSAILGVHLWGRPCDVEALSQIAERKGLALLFDAAHAFGCTLGGRPIGGLGACEVFSFHATKFVHCGEGGAVTTNDDALAERLRLMRNFGFAGYDHVVSIGTNGKMSELAAAVGLTSLDNQARIVAANRANHEAYRDCLYGIPGIELLAFDPTEQNNYQYVVIEVDESAAGLSRDELIAVLFAENILARRYFFPGCHRMEPYRSQQTAPLPVADELAQCVFAVPTGMQVDERIVERIARLVSMAVEWAPAVRRQLRQRRAA